MAEASISVQKQSPNVTPEAAMRHGNQKNPAQQTLSQLQEWSEKRAPMKEHICVGCGACGNRRNSSEKGVELRDIAKMNLTSTFHIGSELQIAPQDGVKVDANADVRLVLGNIIALDAQPAVAQKEGNPVQDRSEKTTQVETPIMFSKNQGVQPQDKIGIQNPTPVNELESKTGQERICIFQSERVITSNLASLRIREIGVMQQAIDYVKERRNARRYTTNGTQGVIRTDLETQANRHKRQANPKETGGEAGGKQEESIITKLLMNPVLMKLFGKMYGFSGMDENRQKKSEETKTQGRDLQENKNFLQEKPNKVNDESVGKRTKKATKKEDARLEETKEVKKKIKELEKQLKGMKEGEDKKRIKETLCTLRQELKKKKALEKKRQNSIKEDRILKRLSLKKKAKFERFPVHTGISKNPLNYFPHRAFGRIRRVLQRLSKKMDSKSRGVLRKLLAKKKARIELLLLLLSLLKGKRRNRKRKRIFI